MKFFDYIIIGSGIAGLNAALQASKKGTVLVVTKKKLADANTFYAQGGIASVLKKGDNFQKHIHDTMVAGSFHNNKKAVSFIIRKGPQAIQNLIDYGVNFAKNQDGDISLGREGGHQEHRIAHSGDYTGKAIEEALIKNVRKNKGIIVLENCFAKDLIIKSKTCIGVQIIYTKKGAKNMTVENVFGQKIILASGGVGQIFERTTNPSVATGDGIAMAARAGCKLKDLEFIQFHPTAFAERKSPQFLISEAVRGEGAVLRNKKGEKFMIRYHKMADLAPRDVVSRAIFEEEKKGPVYLDLRPQQKSCTKKALKNYEQKISARFPKIYNYLKTQGYNLAKDLVPVTPAAHFSCGGVETDLHGRTSLKNLYAFGEVACTGLHGANRLASNSLLEGLVMSDEIIKEKIQNGFNKTRNVDKSLHVQTRLQLEKQFIEQNIYTSLKPEQKNNSPTNVPKIRENLRKLMWQNVSIVRTPAKLQETPKKIAELEKKLHLNFPTHIGVNELEALETSNMLTTAKLITQAALKRKKSLGTHYLIRR